MTEIQMTETRGAVHGGSTGMVLVNPYIYDFTAYDLWLRPMGLLYIASVLKKYTDCELYWLDALDRFQEGAFAPGESVRKHSHDDYSGKYHREIQEKPAVYRNIPRNYSRYGVPLNTFRAKLDSIPHVDLILVTSLMTYWIDGVELTLRLLRKRFPDAKIIIGGILPNLVPHDRLAQYIHADYFVRGYGETQILEIIKENNGTVYPYPDFSDPDNIPFPAAEFLSSREALPLMTSRGCPYRCTYCASNLLNDGFIQRRPEKILEEIHYMVETHHTGHFVIFDDALLIDKQRRFLKVFREMAAKLKINFHTPNGLHVKEIDRETAEILFQSGFKTLRLSFESTAEELLSRSSGKVTVNQMVTAVENLEAAGYKRKDLGVYLLFGVHGQGVRDIDSALNFVKDQGLTPNLAYYSPVPGTRDFLALQGARVLSAPIDLYETNKIYFIYEKSGLSLSEISAVKEKAAAITQENRRSSDIF